MAEKSKRTLAKRQAQVKIVHEMMKKGQHILLDEGKEDSTKRNELNVIANNIRIKKDLITKLNEIIFDEIDEENIENGIRSSSEFDLCIDTEVRLITERLKDESTDNRHNHKNNIRKPIIEEQASDVDRDSLDGIDRRNYNVRLPKLTVKNFHGNPINWPSLSRLNNAIHENQDLNPIEKFTYLKSYLGGDAERCVDGLSLSAKNYEHALEIYNW